MSHTAIIYARFSSAEQSKGYSLERQRTHGLQFATDKGWSVEKTITDEGRSAFHGANRLEGSALHEFELEARNGLHRGKVLLVENVDRLSRQGAKAAAQLIWALNEQGVDVATWQDGYVYQAGNNGDLMELFSVIIKAQMAFEESDKKSKRTSASWKKRFEQIAEGTHKGPMPNTPNWIDHTDEGFVLNPERTAVLNQIFDFYIDGMGIHRIVTILHERNVPSWTPAEQERGNNGWFYSYIYRLLTKRAVLGEYVTSDGTTLSPDYYPQAVTAEKWNRAQAALSMRKGNQTNVKVFGNRNLLSQMIVCEKCGGGAHFGHTTDTVQKYTKVSGEVVNYRRKTYRKLRCDRARRKHNCDNPTILNYDVVEATILQEMLPQLVRKPDANAQATKLREQIADMARAQDVEQGKLNNLIDALADGGSKAIVQRVAAVEAEVERLSADIAAAQKALAIETAKPAGDDDVALVESLMTELTSEDDEVRIYARGRVNMSLRRLIQRIVITEVGTFRVEPDAYSAWTFDAEGNLLEGGWTLSPEEMAA
ncbi:recombinase family protein [Sphingobium sp. CR2-8]|uniref:recombinase family protein n=1 Tax=Sphingobium sp. CR2-8 TaxID=1306534 RepID=UPI002DBDD630|nr:recombinase family protein [Sphingobium sp. CR2-8]MEC3910092.1 recombinase family protein [Sphingobium sp. CR2-8]